jgi:hypothetical protein
MPGCQRGWRGGGRSAIRGKAVLDLAVMLVLCGDCLADAALLRTGPELFGPVTSDPVISRLVSALAGDGGRALRTIRSARAAGGREGLM